MNGRFEKYSVKRKTLSAIFISILLIMLIKINILSAFNENSPPLVLTVKHASYEDVSGAFESESEDIYGELSELLPTGFPEGDDSFDFMEITELVLSEVTAGRSRIVSFALTLIGTALLLSLAERGIFDGGLEGTVGAALSGVLSIPIFTSMYSLITECCNCIQSGCDFFGGLVPIMVSVTALGGGTASSLAEGAGMSLALGFVSEVILSSLVPISSLIFALSLATSLDKEGVLGSLTSLVKGILVAALGFISMLLPATLAMQTVIASAKDTVTLRTAKYAAGNMIPIVGGAVSGALSTLSAGAGLLRSTVGAVGAGVLVYIFLAPTLTLLLYRLCFRLALTLLDFVGVCSSKRMLSSLLGALDSLTALVATSGIIFLLEVIIFMRTVVSL